MSSSFNESSLIDDSWLFDSPSNPMFALINPNEILNPYEIISVDHQQVDRVTDITNQVNNYTYNLTTNNNQYNQHNQLPATTFIETNSIDLKQHELQAQPLLMVGQQEYQSNQYIHTALIEPPPTLLSYDEPKLKLQHKLELHRVLSQQRRDRLKARLEKQPPQLPVQIMRKGSNRKLTGRERLMELEKEEERLLQMRSQYLETINQLEQKCNKLRDILGQIVTKSPEYNAHMIHFLETSEPLFDRTENASTMISSENDRNLAIENIQNY